MSRAVDEHLFKRQGANKTGRAGEPRMPCNDELAKLKSGFRTPNILITSSIILYADSNYGIANMNTYAWYSYYIFMDIQEYSYSFRSPSTAS